MEFVHLPDVNAVGILHQVARLVDEPGLGERQELAGVFGRYLLLPLEAAYAGGIGRALDGEESLIVADADAHRAARRAADITLDYVIMEKGLFPEAFLNQKFAFYLLTHSNTRMVSPCSCATTSFHSSV